MKHSMKIVGWGGAFLLIAVMSACGPKKAPASGLMADSLSVEAAQDTTVYGICGENTAMHTLELIKDDGDTVSYFIDEADGQDLIVKGGLFTGDRMAVVGHQADGEMVADQVLNLTALLGRWTSLDKNFEIQEGGTVVSSVKAESNPWTAWKILNGRLLLNKDTFRVDNLGADSLLLENASGIFTFKRQQ